MPPLSPPETSVAEFTAKLCNDWLPLYCNDPDRRYSIEGYKPKSNKVTEEDAANFLRAMEEKMLIHDGGGRYRMPRSKAREVLFWEGSKAKTLRPITLWMEPVITIATVARLHLDYKWPAELIGMQSRKGEFDVMTFLRENIETEYIAGEVKKTANELNFMLDTIFKLAESGEVDIDNVRKTERNAHKKLLGLMRCRAPLFWAIGPGRVERVFEVDYSRSPRLVFKEVSSQRLAYPRGA